MRHIQELSQLSAGQRVLEMARSDFDDHAPFLTQIVDMCLFDNASGRVATCGYWDYAVRVHSVESHREVASSMGHVGAITGLQLDRNGQMMISCGIDGTCRVWVVERTSIVSSFQEEALSSRIDIPIPTDTNMICVHVLCGHHSPVTAMCFSSELNLLVSGAEKGSLCLHDVIKGEYVRSFVASGEPIHAVFITPHGYVLSHSWSNLKLQSYWLGGQLLNDVQMFARYHNISFPLWLVTCA